MNFYKHCPH